MGVAAGRSRPDTTVSPGGLRLTIPDTVRVATVGAQSRWGWLVPFGPVIALLGAIVVVWQQSRTSIRLTADQIEAAENRARDDADQRRAQVERDRRIGRLDRQLAELYGPLLAEYEAGERNWFAFVLEFSFDEHKLKPLRRFFPAHTRPTFRHPDPEALAEYRRRMRLLFQPTNRRMRDIISAHLDLVVGFELPPQLVAFLAHAASVDELVARWSADESFTRSVASTTDAHTVYYVHPSGMQHYIRAAFAVLADARAKMLGDAEIEIGETETAIAIALRARHNEWAALPLNIEAHPDTHITYADRDLRIAEERGELRRSRLNPRGTAPRPGPTPSGDDVHLDALDPLHDPTLRPDSPAWADVAGKPPPTVPSTKRVTHRPPAHRRRA